MKHKVVITIQQKLNLTSLIVPILYTALSNISELMS